MLFFCPLKNLPKSLLNENLILKNITYSQSRTIFWYFPCFRSNKSNKKDTILSLFAINSFGIRFTWPIRKEKLLLWSSFIFIWVISKLSSLTIIPVSFGILLLYFLIFKYGWFTLISKSVWDLIRKSINDSLFSINKIKSSSSYNDYKI